MRGSATSRRLAMAAMLGLVAVATGCGSSGGGGSSTNSTTTANKRLTGKLTVLGAGTLANPFAQEFAAFKRAHPGVTVASNFAGSSEQAKKITDLGQQADVLGVADYSVIPKYLGKAHKATWYVGFAGNQITFAYTPHSKGASQIGPNSWYRVLAQPGVRIGRSNPDTDPSGYQLLQMLQLSGAHYHDPGLSQRVLANSPASTEADTETSLLAALQSGQIDYLGIYRSDALQHHLRYVHLPAQVDLGDASLASHYATASVSTANGPITGKPIVYAMTVPTNAANPALGEAFVRFVLGPQGRAIMARNGFEVLQPAYASDTGKVPADLRGLTRPWPGNGG